ncbi:TonB-dependent siderophore receptor [Rhizorhabdus sp. FW153]|uniref:TonB-dependent siderophore receptor n=1 Tax=Rhizorhabdus sp. FW153 TaxID=3400216 RepID=UPI003CE924C8
MTSAILLATVGIVATSGATTVVAQFVDSAPGATQDQEIIVVGDAFTETEGLLAKQSSTGSRFPVDVEKLPNTIRILPQELIDATAATLPQDVTKYVSGVQTLPGFGTSVGYVIRGFFANYETLQNGVRVSDNPGDLSNIERIEILKGPIGSLYGGTGAFAGNVNIITKRPRDRFAAEVRAYGGSDSFYRIEGDVAGPLAPGGTLKYRLTGAAESSGSFQENVDSRKFVVSPSVAFEPNDRVSIRLDGSYINRRYTFFEGLPLLDGSLPAGLTTFDLDLSQTFHAPDRSQTRETNYTLAGEGNFRLTDALTLRVAGNYSNYDIRIGSSRLGLAVQPDGRTFDRFTFQGPQQIERHTIQSDLIYTVKGLGVETVFLAGYERFQNRYDYAISGRALPPLDVLDPVNPPAGIVPLEPQFSGFFTYQGDAVYGQVFSQITPRLAVLAGLRYDWQTNESIFNGSGDRISDSQPSPRLGVTWSIADDSILFANWAKSFSPSFALDSDGEVFPPDQVRQYEAGVRQKLFGGRALATLAYFDIRRSNVVIPDVGNFAQSIAVGEQTSRGAEFDLTGRVLPHLDMILTYAWNRTRVAEKTDANFGQQLPAAPEHSASAFVRYSVDDGVLKGLSANAGLTYASRIQASLPSTIFIPPNARLDLGVAYELADCWRLGLNVNNVTNSNSYVTNLFALYPLAPRQFLFTLSRRFGASS